MRKIICILFATGLFSVSSFAQVANYTFSQATNTYDTLVGGKVLGTVTTPTAYYFTDSIVSAGSATVTSGIGLPINFNFVYNGTTFDMFGVNSNGWIGFGQSALAPTSVNLATTTVTTPISSASTAPANLQNRVVALGRGLIAQATSKLSYATLGVAPNRMLVVEWRNFKRTTGGAVDTLNFQIRLHETTNIVEFLYGKMKFNSQSTNVELGLRGTANTDYNNRTTTTSWAATNAGATNNATMTVSATIFPAFGTTYVWSPPIIYQFDAGLTAINAPVSPIAIGANNVTVTIKNFGSDSLKTASIAWNVDNVLQTPFSFLNAGLPLNSTNGPITIGSFNFTAAGTYVIKAWTENPNANTDANNANDTITKTVFAQGYAPLPFTESFNNAWINIMNTRDVPSVYWVNTPNTGNNSWRRDDDGAAAAWTNVNNGAYTPAGVGTGTLRSARFHSRSATVGSTGTLDAYMDFSPVGTKMLKFWHINTSGTDTLSLLISSDAGATYSVVQKFATAAAWTQHYVSLGNSVDPQTIVRFRVINSATGTTDVGLDSVQVVILPKNDAGITSIDAPNTPVSFGNIPVNVTVKNYGDDNLTDANIEWSVNSVVQTPAPYTNAGLVTNAADGPINIGNYNFTTDGFYTIKAWTTSPNGGLDPDNSNDTSSKVVYVQGYAPIPFMEGFDSLWINKNATRDVPTKFWANTPATGNNSWRRDEDTLSAPWTNAGGGSGFYSPKGANNTIHSARFHSWDSPANTTGIMDLFVDLSLPGNKLLDFWNINVDGNDSLSVYLSTNGGSSFIFVQKFLTSTTWTHNIIPLGNSTSTTCVVRFKAVSDYGNTDMGLDQVQIYLSPDNDIAAYKWLAPISGCGLTNSEHVSVKVINQGLLAQTNVPVIYSIDGGLTYVGPESIPGTINPGDTTTYTFTAASSFIIPGSYNCIFVVENPGDQYVPNDTLNFTINSVGIISGNPFVDSLEAGNDYYLLSNGTNSAVALSSGAGNLATTGFDMTGGVAGTWPAGSSATTTGPQAFSYTDHVAIVKTCSVDATAFPANQLFLKLDLKQTHSSTGNKYSYFMVLVNGTDTVSDISGTKFFNAVTGNADPFAAKYFNLGIYAGQLLTIEFVSACKYNDASQTPADHVYFDNIVLYVPPVINDLGPDTTICQGSSITFDAGAGAGYTYLWTQQPAGTQVGTAQTLTVNTSGTYQVVVTNSLGLTAADAVTITISPALAADAGIDTTITYLATANLHGSVGASGSYSYAWAPADSLVDATLQNPTTVPLHTSAIFTLYVTNLTTGCVGSDQVTVFVTGGPLSVTATATPDTICAGDVIGLSALPSGGSGIYTYSWTSVPTGFTSTGVNTADMPLVNTVYNVVVNDGTNTANSSVSVIVHPLPVVSLGADTILCTTSTISLNAGTGTSYLWSTGENTQSIIIDSNDAVGGVANIWVKVFNSYGCSKSDTVAVTFVSCTGINEYGNDVSIAMYPNPSNGMTNLFVTGLNSDANLTIYSLQGQLVYSGRITRNALTSLDLSAMPKGIYTVRIQNEQNSLISKLILQ